jgi:hypothetical protein
MAGLLPFWSINPVEAYASLLPPDGHRIAVDNISAAGKTLSRGGCCEQAHGYG